MNTLNIYAAVFHIMGLMRSFTAGGVSYWISLIIWHDNIVAFWAAILGFFLAERMTHGAHKRKLLQQHNVLNRRLLLANDTIHGMDEQLISTQEQLTINNDKLSIAIIELERRDAVGSPATRELIKRQDETLAIQSSAIAENAKSHERAMEMFSVLERAVCAQGEQGREMLSKMSQIVERLALEPRNTTVTMQDSVLVQGDERSSHPVGRPSQQKQAKRNNDSTHQPTIMETGAAFTALINPKEDIDDSDKRKLNSLLQTLL
mgnify:CR=1 FL=1|jgi:hypothetical protein